MMEEIQNAAMKLRNISFENRQLCASIMVQKS